MAQIPIRETEEDKVKEYVISNPKAPYSEAKKALNLRVSDVTYYIWRKKYKHLAKTPAKTHPSWFKPRGPQSADYQKLCDILPANPSMTYDSVQKMGLKISANTYRRYKEAILTGSITKRPTKKNVYMPVFTVSSEEILPESKKLLRDFVNALNVANRTTMEVVEYAEPKILEVREIS